MCTREALLSTNRVSFFILSSFYIYFLTSVGLEDERSVSAIQWIIGFIILLSIELQGVVASIPFVSFSPLLSFILEASLNMIIFFFLRRRSRRANHYPPKTVGQSDLVVSFFFVLPCSSPPLPSPTLHFIIKLTTSR